MKKLLLTLSFLSILTTQVVAAEPATIILPTPVVNAIAQYLSQRPYAESAQYIAALQQCLSVQLPDASGRVVSHGECPAVTEAMKPQVPIAPAAGLAPAAPAHTPTKN